MERLKKTEILSPVGNKEMLSVAVRSGADAVYLGAKDFSARRNAENFSLAELQEAINYCHIRGVKVYLTLNILIKDNEFEAAFNLAQSAYNLGIDGIIIEDLGLARVLHEKIPDLKLHASTQMSVHTPAALNILKESGFCQVVAAREMSKTELVKLCEKAKELNIVVEVFVHGALCMCVSGQCLLSAFLGSRSGNRGLCAGPCRLPFKAPNGTGYDLSLKDLSLLPYLRELESIGVGSFKIEGRMKRPEYVAAATAACREALDKGEVNPELSETLKNVFSRQGFTDGYYKNSLGRNMFGTRTKEDVVSANEAFPKLHEIYRGEYQKIGLDINAEILKDKPITLNLSDGENEISVQGSVPQLAKNKAIDGESAKKNLLKFGSTQYFAKSFNINLDDGLFVPASELNNLRRLAAEDLDKKRAALKIIPSDESYVKDNSLKTDPNKTPKLVLRIENICQLPDNTENIEALIYPLEEDPEKLILKVKNIPLIVDIPRGIISEELIAKRLKLFKEKGFKTALCGNLSAVYIAKSLGFNILGGTGLNIGSSETLKTFKELGLNSAVISSEQTVSDILKITPYINKGIIAYGNIPLMLFKNCPLKNGRSCETCDKKGYITDRKGISFPVRCRLGYSEMLNSLPIWLADRKSELKGLDFLILYFTREEKQRVEEVLNAYRNGLSPDTEYTRGLFYRGTI